MAEKHLNVNALYGLPDEYFEVPQQDFEGDVIALKSFCLRLYTGWMTCLVIMLIILTAVVQMKAYELKTSIES